MSGYILPLYKRHSIFSFLDPEKTEYDFEIIKNAFELTDVSKIIQLLEENDKKWDGYLQRLFKVRRIKLFNSADEVPNEKTKIDEYAKLDNKLAVEMKKILECKSEIPRTWPIPEIEEKMKRYAEWKKIPKMPEQAFDYLVYNALKEIYFPSFFFKHRIFKLEEEYSGFKFGFLDFLGPEILYLSYQIYSKKGNEQVIDNIRDFIVNRYIPKPTFGVDAVSIMTYFLWGGIDVNNCNRFFTRRMKKDISRESDEHTHLTNNMRGEKFEDAFKRLFYADPSSTCNLKNPFVKARNEPGLIEQAILNHLVGNYSASVNLLFPLIEGIIWDISVSEHLRNHNIYTDDSDLTTRDVRKRTLLGKNGSQLAKPHNYPILRELLELTAMGDIIDTDFMKMFIQEMYPSERNPILHGTKLDYNDAWQSSRMLLMLEYLFALIETQKYQYPEQLDEQGYWTPEKNREKAQADWEVQRTV